MAFYKQAQNLHFKELCRILYSGGVPLSYSASFLLPSLSVFLRH
jgi:hypothetical protein